MHLPKSKRWVIYNPVYGYQLFVTLGGTIEEWDTWFKKKFKRDDSGIKLPLMFEKQFAACCQFYYGTKNHSIWYPYIPGSDTIAHESLHSIMHIAAELGFHKCVRGKDETYAYLLDWTFREQAIRMSAEKERLDKLEQRPVV